MPSSRDPPLFLTNPSKFDLIQYHFLRSSFRCQNPSCAQLKSKVVQTSKDGSVSYALMDCASGKCLAVPIGLYADCMPSAGVSGLFSCLVCISMLIPFTASSTGPDNLILKDSSVQPYRTRHKSAECTA